MRRSFSLDWLFSNCLVVILTTVAASSVLAQQNFNPQLKIPKPPEVGAFEKFIESPVSLHTGLHDVTIPVYEISLDGLTLPVSIKYHSGGNKVDDVATEVGLGWSLEASGVVSSTVHGIPDEQGDWPNNYYAKIDPLTLDHHYNGFNVSVTQYETNCSEPWNLYTVYSSTTDFDFMRGVVQGLRDSEPDLYFFSLPGSKSGKFYIDQNNQFQTIPYQKVKIERITSGQWNSGYKITDEKGNIYEFTKRAVSTTVVTPWCSPQPDLANCFPPNVPNYPNYPHSSFHLTKITTIEGDVVDFHYSAYSYSLQNQMQFSRTARLGGDIYECLQFIKTPEENVCLGKTESVTSMGTFALDSITTNKGHKITFTYAQTARLDNGVKTLSAIAVHYKKQNLYETLKVFQLNHSYFVSTESASANSKDNYRLRLDNAGEVGKPFYSFEYDDTELPHRLSYSQDHWGMYNGGANTHLLPKEEHMGFEMGANREPDFEKATAGILKKVHYPTGGTLGFEYEPNTYYSEGGEKYYETGTTGLYSVADQVVTLDFTVQANHVRQKFIWSNTDGGTTIHNDLCKIEILGPNYSRLLYGEENPQSGDLVFLPPGNYTMRIETVGTTYSGWVAFNWLTENVKTAGNRITGGIRIKKTLNCPDGSGENCLEKNYDYLTDDGASSSGIAFNTPLYSHVRESTFWTPGLSCGNVPIQCNPVQQSSSSITPLFNSQGTHVVYSQVQVREKDPTKTGKTSFKFLVDVSQNPTYAAPPFPVVITYDWLNGLPLETIQYAYANGQYLPVRKTTNDYAYTAIANRPAGLANQSYTRGVKINLYNYPFGSFVQCGTMAWYEMIPLDFELVPYSLISSWHYLTKSTVTDYNQDGTEGASVSTDYLYENPIHIQVTEEMKTDSRGVVTKVLRSYPVDYVSPSNTTLQSMVTKNMIASVVEQIHEKDMDGTTVVVGAELVEYKAANGTVLPDKISKLGIAQPLPSASFVRYDGSSRDARYQTELELELYDASNNIIQYKDKSGVTRTFIWDYNSDHTVAEVVNATIQDVAYTSFEATNDGYWTVPGLQRSDDGVTGSRCYSLASGAISRSGLAQGVYRMSAWIKAGGSFQVIGEQLTATSTLTVGQWTYYEYEVKPNASGVIQVQGNALIDEVRLCPKGAMMTSYTHRPGIGISSSTDPTGLPKYFEYDNNRRIVVIRDHKKNILANYVYNYKSNP